MHASERERARGGEEADDGHSTPDWYTSLRTLTRALQNASSTDALEHQPNVDSKASSASDDLSQQTFS